MFWRKKEDSGKIPAVTKYIAGLISDVDEIKERLKQLECEHLRGFKLEEGCEYATACVVSGYETRTYPKYYKTCNVCGKKWAMSKCEWLKEKHKQEKAIADQTAKELKECKP